MISNSSERNTTIDGSKPKMPTRPLTAYNLFVYKYKRSKTLEASNTGLVMEKKNVRQIVHATLGLENYPSTMRNMIPPDRLDKIHRNEIHCKIIRLALDQQLLAKDDNKKRSHKRSSKGCKMGFTEMNTEMGDGWKKSDDFSKAIFKKLAEDGKTEYNRKLARFIVNRKSTQSNPSAVLNRHLKTPGSACRVPWKTTSNMKDSPQGLDNDSLVPISVAPHSCVEKKHNIATSSAPKSISSSTHSLSEHPKYVCSEAQSPAVMGNLTLLNDSFEHPLEVTPFNSRAGSFNGGNSFGDAACFEANSHHQNAYGRVTQPNNTLNMAGCNGMSTQDVYKDTDSDDDFMDMINKTLK